MAPGAAASFVAESIIKDQKKVITSSIYLNGEYGMKDINIGVPVIIGRKGIEKVIELDLTQDERAKFEASAEAVRKTNDVLAEIKLI